MKRALVLAGGGSKGAYEVGFIKALDELNIDFSIVTGTSIGALNGCLLAQGDKESLENLWKTLDVTQVFKDGFSPDFSFDLEKMLNQSNLALSFFKHYIKEKGADITPLKNIMKSLLDEDKLRVSSIDFGLCTVRYPSLKPLFITKNEMEKGHVLDYLIASASCFPIFPIHTFLGQSYIDGGYYDNVPIDLAFSMGADEVIVVDMNKDITHRHYLNRPHVIYTSPYLNLGGFMDFSRESLDRNMRIGYQTAMKTFGHLKGVEYTFQPFESQLLQSFYREILYLERLLRKLLRNDSGGNLVYKFMESHKDQPLEEEDYLYVGLDWLAQIENRDPSYIYQYDLFVLDVLKDFKKYIDEDYQMISLRSSEDIMKSFKDLNRKSMIGRMLHALIYPHEEKLDIEKLLILFPKEYIIAKLLFMLYNEHKQKTPA